MADARVDLRLLLAHPENLGRGKASQRVVASERDQPLTSNARANLVALRGGALVVPEDRRTQDSASLVQHHEAVHLPRQPDRRHIGACASRLPQRLADAVGDARVPVLRRLLGPERSRRREREWRRRAGHDLPAAINQQRLRAGRRDVDAKEQGTARHDRIPFRHL